MEKDEHIYSYVFNELENNIKDENLWIKAYVKSEGIEEKKKPLYITYRVEKIKEIFRLENVDYEKITLPYIFEKEDIPYFPLAIDGLQYLIKNFEDDEWIDELLRWIKDTNSRSLPKHKDSLLNLNECEMKEGTNFPAKIKVTTLPSSFSKLPELEKLILRGDWNLKEVFKIISHLPNLKTLHIRNYTDLVIPSEISMLSNLEDLVLERCYKIKELPKEICNLINLKRLSLFECELLEKLPKEIGNLINLELLYIKKLDNLKMMPLQIGNLINLEKLGIESRSLKMIPSEIGNLVNLEVLGINSESLSTVPSEITKLTNLEYLDLDNCDITSLPKDIINLKNLDTIRLYVRKNLELTREQIEWLYYLKKNNNCKLEGIGLDIRRRVKSFNLIDIEDYILDEIWDWAKLNGVDIPRDKVNLLSMDTFSLEEFYSGKSELRTLPKNIHRLENLLFIYLSKAKFSEIPEEIFNMTQLKKLKFYFNDLKEISKSIVNLHNLEFLGLSHNQLSEIPKEIGKLNNLWRIDLSYNQLKEIPIELKYLNNLQYLDLRNNQLSKIPDELSSLLHAMDLSGNPNLKLTPSQEKLLAPNSI